MHKPWAKKNLEFSARPLGWVGGPENRKILFVDSAVTKTAARDVFCACR